MACFRTAMLLAACSAALAAPPKYDEKDVQGTAHVPAYATQDADPVVVEAIAQVCDATVQAFRDDLKLPVPEPVTVYVSATRSFWSGVITDGKSKVFAAYRADDLDVGQRRTAGSGPLGVVSRAAGAVCSAHRVPGLARFVAAEIVVPRLAAAPNAKPWPKAYDWLAKDGPSSLAAQAGDPQFLRNHPDHAAAWALREVNRVLGTAWLAQQLAALAFDDADAIKALHVAAVQADPKLHAAFKEWDAATTWERDKDGSVLINSFETPADLTAGVFRNAVDLRLAGAWKSDGQRSLVATFPAKSAYPRFGLLDDDWRYADVSAFGSIELDVRNPGEQPVKFELELADSVARLHGGGRQSVTVPANSVAHVVLPLVPLAGEAPASEALWWDGHVNLRHIAELSVVMHDTPATPTVLEFDNLRLKP